MLAQRQARAGPTVHVTEDDYDRLLNLAAQEGPGAELLARELDRAVVVRQARRGRRFVRLGSWVEYEDRPAGKVRRVQVVPPDAADIDENRLSVISPVGAALIGLSEGDVFSWTAADGRPRLIAIVAIGDDPPR